MQFLDYVQKLWPKSRLDHNLVSIAAGSKRWEPKPFRFYNYWFDVEGFNSMIENS